MREFEDTASRTTTTENQLADAFETFLRERRNNRAFPRLDGIYREVPGIQGVADFVGIQSRNWKRRSKRLHEIFADYPRGPAAELLALLERPLDRQSVLLKTSYTKGVLTSVLTRFVEAGIVQRGKNDTYRVSPRFRLPHFELYFFELKLSKWQRALAQAIQAKMYANKVFCVFPLTAARIVSKRRLIFEQMEVGVLLFDSLQMQLSEPIRVKKAESARASYKIDILLRLADLESRASAQKKRKSRLWGFNMLRTFARYLLDLLRRFL
jgi:hypothetical protein